MALTILAVTTVATRGCARTCDDGEHGTKIQFQSDTCCYMCYFGVLICLFRKCSSAVRTSVLDCMRFVLKFHLIFATSSIYQEVNLVVSFSSQVTSASGMPRHSKYLI